MKKLILSAAFGAMVMAPAAFAEEHVIEMRNTGSDRQPMVFEPAYLEIAPGDTVTFVNAMGVHNAQTIDGMLPEGVEGFVGDMNSDVSFIASEEGLYGIKCLPHYGLGMVAVSQVGDDTANLEAARAVRHPARANQRMPELLSQVQE